jgi:hypothetical protein
LTERFGQLMGKTNSDTKRRFPMRTKQTLLALSTAIMLLGAGSLAMASDHDPTDSEGGGIKVGPLGQVFSGPQTLGPNARAAYGYVAPSQGKHTTHKQIVRHPSK